MSVQSNASSKSWKEWLSSRKSSSFINKSHQEGLFKIFDYSINEEKCKSDLESHEETAFLFRQSFGTNRVSIFHHVKSIGRNSIYGETQEIGFIQGIEEGTTCFLTPDIDSLIVLPQEAPVPVPTMTHMLAVSSIEDVDTLVVGPRTTYTPRNFIPIPPFLLEIVSSSISNSNGNSKNILIEAAREIKHFDTIHANDQEYEEKAKSKCKDLLAWLFLVGMNVVHKVPTMGCNNKQIIDYFSTIEKECLSDNNPIQNGININTDGIMQALQRPLEILATSASSTQDFMQKLTQIQSQNSEKASKSFKKIAPKYQRMLLMASSEKGIVPLELNKEAMAFFKQSSILNAQIFLNSHLEALQIDCTVSPGLTTALLNGSFLWSNSLTPSGLSSSVIVSSDIIRFDTLHEGIVLDYSTKHEMTSHSLEKLTKTQVLFPTSIEASIERFRAIHALIELFFSKGSLPQQGVKKFTNLCIDNKNLLRTKFYLDEMLTTD